MKGFGKKVAETGIDFFAMGITHFKYYTYSMRSDYMSDISPLSPSVLSVLRRRSRSANLTPNIEKSPLLN